MSSVPSATQQQKMHFVDKRQQLIRSGSIDKIMQFNSYLCSQNFYILPGIISWMKSSQTILQSHLDKYMTVLKSIIFKMLLLVHYKVVSCVHQDLVLGLLANCYSTLFSLYKSTSAQTTTFCTYLAVVAIFAQLTACLYVIFNYYLSLSVFFLITCIHLISYLNLSTSLHYLKTETNKNKFRYY